MLDQPNAKYFRFHYDEERQKYQISAQARHDLYLALLELELADSIIDIMELSENRPELRLKAAVSLAEQLLGSIRGLSPADRQKLSDTCRLLKRCESPEELLKPPTFEYLPSNIVCATSSIMEVMAHVFESDKDAGTIYDNALSDRILLHHNAEFQRMLKENK